MLPNRVGNTDSVKKSLGPVVDCMTLHAVLSDCCAFDCPTNHTAFSLSSQYTEIFSYAFISICHAILRQLCNMGSVKTKSA